MLDDHQQAVTLLRTGEQHRTLAGGPHGSARWRRQVDAVVR
jgi:hypothetical protein